MKNIAAPPASAYSTPKIIGQQQKLLYRDVHGPDVENRRKNMQKFQLFCERKSAAYLLGLVIIFRTSLAVPTVLICSGDVPLLLCISLRQWRVVSKSAFKVLGKNTTFGTLLKVLYPTPISPFDFSVPICGPWAVGGPRILPEAQKTGIPDGKSRPNRAPWSFQVQGLI